jgi:hypothetical protein
VYWFGTGYSADSPYGEWGKDATPPPIACNEKDFLENFARTSPINTSQDYNQDVYIPLVVDFPLKTITGIDNLTCSALEGDETKGYVMECKVTAPGTITSQFNFTATQGKFYYRYKQGVCYGNIIPLKVTDDIRDWKTLNFQSVYSDIYFGAIKISDYSLDVPQQTISYNLTAFDPPPANLPPARPSITGAKNGFPATEYTFDFKATDPDNDQIRYAIDWNDDGKIDQWLPAVGNVNSGTIQKGSKTWSSIGLKTIKAQTFDEQGNSSDWTTHTINLTPILHAPVASLTSVSNITEKSAIINWKYSDKDGDDQINYEIQIAKTRADLLTERNLVKNPFGGSRPDIISARTHPISGLSPDTTYYVRIRVKADAAPAWSLWTDGFYKFTTKEIDDATTFACDDPQTVLPEQSATFSVSPRGADSYKWYRTTTSLDQIGDSYKYTEKFDSEGSYSRTVRVVDQAVTKILTCNVNVGCGEEPSNCKDGKIQINSCTPTGWKTTATDKNCNGTNPQTPLVTAFEFDPNIVEEGGSCPLILKATDVTSCTLKKGTTEFPYDAINNKISIFKTEVLPVGTYDLSCIGADDGPMKQFGSKSCYSNPIIKED